MDAPDTKTRLLDAAAGMVQSRGYHGFSFHDLAAEVGVKTASIHYHFPTKANLGKALVGRYTDAFLSALGSPGATTPAASLHRYIDLFRAALVDGRMCLCGMIGAEVDGVPVEVAKEASEFFVSNHQWLTRVFEKAGETPAAARRKARLFLSALEGAMLIARASNDAQAFGEVAETVLALCSPAAKRARRAP